MTVNNGVEITMNDVIGHLKFYTSDGETVYVHDTGEGVYLKYDADIFNQLTLSEGVITFGSVGYGPTFASYSWV